MLIIYDLNVKVPMLETFILREKKNQHELTELKFFP